MEELEGLSVQEEYEIEILLIVSRLIEMSHNPDHPEPLNFNYNHSAEWNRLFEKLYDYTIKIAERLWPNKTVKLAKDEDSKTNLTSDHYPIPPYENMIISALKAYKSVKDNKEQRFWNYYIKCLKNLIYRHYSNIMIDSRHHLTTRQKATFRKMLHTWHKVETKYPNFYSKQVKEYLLEKKLFQSEKELDNFYRLLSGSLIISLDEGHQASPKNEKNTIFSNSTIYESFDFLEECFLKKINLKIQSPEKQIKNELFYKDLITFYAISNSLKKYPELSPEKLYSLIFTKKFASRRIIEKYRERDQLLASIIARDKKNVPLMKKNPVSYEYISFLNIKNPKYASKQMQDFLKFCDTQKGTVEIQEKTQIDEEHLKEEINSLELHFEKFITKKIQNEEAQKKKIDFYKEIVTLFIAETFLKTYKDLDFNTLKTSLEKRNFTSEEVLKALSENKKVSYKSISIKHGKQANYGSKVKANFQNS